MEGVLCEMIVGGLQGGHSGVEIHKERGNSNCLFGRILWRASQEVNVGLVSVSGGLADNAIPRETKAVLVVNGSDWDRFSEIVNATAEKIAEELSTKDPDVRIQIKEGDRGNFRCVTIEDTVRAAAFLVSLPNGVQGMSADMPGLVETSLNMGILKGEEGKLCAAFAVRSSVESAKEALIERMAAVVKLAGGSYHVAGGYPGWKYRVDSPLRDKMVALYDRMYGVKPKVEAIHAGLECGLLGSKIEDLDCVSFGPQMNDIHTTEETLSIASTARVWDYLVKLLEEKD